VDAGVSPANVTTTSYGKEKPACAEHNESCWQENRRGHFTHDRLRSARHPRWESRFPSALISVQDIQCDQPFVYRNVPLRFRRNK
jgi:hypothetical protein